MSLDYDFLQQIASQTKVIISFGARKGGFEFVTQLRRDIHDKIAKGTTPETLPRLVYVDAFSVDGLPGSRKVPGVATDKGTNEKVTLDYMVFRNDPHWRDFFNAAMGNARTAVFLITKQWLKSPWCYDELKMYDAWISPPHKRPIKPVMVVWPDAVPLLQEKAIQSRKMDDKGARQIVNPARVQQILQKGPGFTKLWVRAPALEGHEVTLPTGRTWTYQTDYTTDEPALKEILNEIKAA